MKRLTKDNDTQYDFVGKYDTNIEEFTNNKDLRNDVLNKLGQIEDIEEEIGIDLLTLFKAKKVYWRIKLKEEYEHSMIRESYSVRIDLTYNYLIVYRDGYDECGIDFEFSEYGKTWALTKEELENV